MKIPIIDTLYLAYNRNSWSMILDGNYPAIFRYQAGYFLYTYVFYLFLWKSTQIRRKYKHFEKADNSSLIRRNTIGKYYLLGNIKFEVSQTTVPQLSGGILSVSSIFLGTLSSKVTNGDCFPPSTEVSTKIQKPISISNNFQLI